MLQVNEEDTVKDYFSAMLSDISCGDQSLLNHTSGKIKLTPSVDSYAIVLLVLTLKLLVDGFNRCLF